MSSIIKERDLTLKLLHKQIDTLKRANEVRDELITKGYHDPVIKKVG